MEYKQHKRPIPGAFDEYPQVLRQPSTYPSGRCRAESDGRLLLPLVAGFGSLDLGLLPLPRLARVTCARYRLLGANTPWKRLRLTRGLGTGAASRTMKSNGSNFHDGGSITPDHERHYAGVRSHKGRGRESL